jgi:hypothetical protein
LHTNGILLEQETYTALVKTIQRDCRVGVRWRSGACHL